MTLDVDELVSRLCEQLAGTAAERDGADDRRNLIRESGLLALAIPRRFGGMGKNWHATLVAVRRIAEVDISLAYSFAVHHLQVASIILFGNEQQQSILLSQTVSDRWFWGNAVNPADNQSKAYSLDEWLLVNGSRNFYSGVRGADMLLISAHLDPCNTFLVAAIPANRDGVEIDYDLDATGLGQEDSGTVRFNDVFVEADELLQEMETNGSIFASLRACLEQLIQVELHLGLAGGAFLAALGSSGAGKQTFGASGVLPDGEDGYLLSRVAGLWVTLRGAAALADIATEKLDVAWNKGEVLSTAERGDVAIAVYEAKVLAHQASLDISAKLFNVVSDSATLAGPGLDRTWRNARNLAIQAPIDGNLRDIGNWALNKAYPAPNLYN